MINNISPRIVREVDMGEIDELLVPRPEYLTYDNLMRIRELDKGYNGRWLE